MKRGPVASSFLKGDLTRTFSIDGGGVQHKGVIDHQQQLKFFSCPDIGAGINKSGIIFEIVQDQFTQLLFCRQVRNASGEVVQQILQVIFERSEEHTSELQSLMRISYAVFC